MTSKYAIHEHHEFLEATQEALGSANLQLALSRLGETLAAGNQRAFAELPGSSLLRDKARAIKDQTLAHLDEHLVQLERSVIARALRASNPEAVKDVFADVELPVFR